MDLIVPVFAIRCASVNSSPDRS